MVVSGHAAPDATHALRIQHPPPVHPSSQHGWPSPPQAASVPSEQIIPPAAGLVPEAMHDPPVQQPPPSHVSPGQQLSPGKPQMSQPVAVQVPIEHAEPTATHALVIVLQQPLVHDAPAQHG
jgi:hypothetical protein